MIKEKRAHISDTVLHLLEGITVANQRANIGVIMGRDIQVARAVSQKGYPVVVVGDCFKPLFRFHLRKPPYNPVLTVEGKFRELPLLPEAFDVIVVARPFPRGSDVGRELLRLQRFIKSGGTLMWIHPLYDGMFGKLRRAFASRWYRMARHVICQTAMASGFCQVGQELVRGPGTSKFVLTRATVRRIV